MEQNPEQPNQVNPANPPQEESIFNEADILGSGYDKHIKKARNALFFIAGIEIVWGFITYMQNSRLDPSAIWTEVLIVAAIFAGLGFWSRKNPYAAILTGLIVYILYLILLMIADKRNIYYGIVLKIVIIVSLITGLNNAREAKRIKDALNNK